MLNLNFKVTISISIYFRNFSHFIDVNECDYDNGGCESICINQPGSFKCDCERGLQIENLGRTKCLGKWKCDI